MDKREEEAKRRAGYIKKEEKGCLLGREIQQETDVVEGIIVGDQELDERFTSEPRCYGACEVSDNEKQALSLPPKFVLYIKIDSVSVEAEIEKGLA